MVDFIPYGRQHITEADIEAVVAVLKSDFLTQGLQVPTFEKAVGNYVEADYAVAVNSATSALHLSCLALDLGKNDWLWTVPNTFVASANCALYCGARVDFVDIDPITLNMSVHALAEKLKIAKQKKCLPKIVVPVHFAGEPCDMASIYELSQQYGFSIIEDASHAIGGRYQDKLIGSCQYSHITIFSFHPVKIITTAEGGLATTNCPKLAQKIQLLRSHGITRESGQMQGEYQGDWYYQQIDLGFNYRMTELQGALGVSQMKNLDKFIGKRHEIAKRYDELLQSLPIILPYKNPNNRSALHLYPIQIHPTFHKRRKQVFDELRQQGIGVNVHYIPIHMQPYYQKMGFKQGDFPNSENYYANAISLPIYYDFTEILQDKVVGILKGVLHDN